MYGEPEKTFGNDPDTNFQKNHDLDLETPLRGDRQYLVQIRYPLQSIVSWFKYKVSLGELRDAPDEWVNFALQQSAYWCRFYRKWVMNPVPGRMILNYADLIESPQESLTKVVGFLGETAPDAARIESCVEAEGVVRKNDYRNFKFYGGGLFQAAQGIVRRSSRRGYRARPVGGSQCVCKSR